MSWDEKVAKATRKVETLATTLYSCKRNQSMETALHCLHALKEVVVAVTELFEPVLKEKPPVEMCPICGHHLVDGECPAKKYTVNDCHEREKKNP
jgi:hypothetical protein